MAGSDAAQAPAAGSAPFDRRSVVLVAAATFAFWLSLYIYVPVFPLHAEELGASLSMVGLVVSSYAIAQLLLRIPIGVAADILGRRKPFAAAALACATAGAVGLALAPGPWSLFAARTLVGVGGAGWVAVSVLFSSYYAADRSGHAMARVMTINSVGLLAATFSGGLISEYFGAEAAFYTAAACGACGTVLMLLAREPRQIRSGSYSAATFRRVARIPLLLLAGAIGILAQFVTFAGSFGFVPLYAERIGASDAEVGYVTTAMLIGQLLGTMAATRIARCCGIRAALFLASGLVGLSLVVVPGIASVWLLMALQGMGGMARGIVNTLLISLSLRAVAPEDRATGMGIYQAIYAAGMLAGPVASGYLAQASSLAAVFYLLAAVSLAAGLLGLLPLIPRRPG